MENFPKTGDRKMGIAYKCLGCGKTVEIKDLMFYQVLSKKGCICNDCKDDVILLEEIVDNLRIEMMYLRKNMEKVMMIKDIAEKMSILDRILEGKNEI